MFQEIDNDIKKSDTEDFTIFDTLSREKFNIYRNDSERIKLVKNENLEN